MKRFPSLLFVLFTAHFVLCGAAVAASGGKVKIILVGDSTVTDRTGWGLGFKEFLAGENAECINVAAGGRSSMSFMREGRWTNALALKGDYYLVQFGHNNEPGKPGRSTDMATYVANLTQYVDEARAIGAKAVLITPLTRRQWDKANPGSIKSSLAPYAGEVRKLAAEKNVPLVDLHARSIGLCEQLGREKCYDFSPVKTVGGTNTFDGTHLKGVGRVMFARLVVEELRQAVPELASALLAEPRDANPKAVEDRFDAIVAADASASHANLQLAINAAPDNGAKAYRILVRPGTYQGQFIIPKEKRHVQLVGENPGSTILTYALNQNESPAPDGKPIYNNAGTVVLADDFHAENVTFQNTSGDHGQALALRVDGDRAVFKDCHLLGWQDTLLIKNGRMYFTNCHIEGRVDFIYGSATAVFDHCEIKSKNGGHVTAASTPQDQPFGFVFLSCKLTSDPKPWVDPQGIPANTPMDGSVALADLGRPWRPYASVTYLNCEMGDHIKPGGWDNWRNPTNELTARFAEFNSSGPGAKPEKRVKWSKQWTREQAYKITVESVLGGKDEWNPAQ